MLFLFLLSSYLLNVLGSEKGPEIKTAFGTYNGFRYNEADVFLGIKYASPARGEMRFEKPTFIERAKITINATAFGPRCFPTFKSDVNLEEATYSEDCLFLNIMMPSKKLEDETGFPILFVIIGGAYNSPNVDSYGFEHWCDNFVSRGMIVVTIQYRHGFLGFFTTGDHYIYGNMALWDLTFGLFYVDNVIPIFNGNRKDVTVMGIDAGAAYASALALSPHSSFLFKKIIQIGGGIYSGFGVSENALEYSKKLMDELKCTNSDRQLQLDCMKLKTIDEIYAAIDTFPRLTKEFGGFMFTPSMDNDFFPDTIQNMIKKAKVKPGIIGFSDKESLDILVNSEQLKERFPMPAEYNEYNLITALKQLAFNDKIEGTTHGKVYEFYNDPQFVLNFPVTHEISLYYLDLLTKITSDILINMPLLNEIELKRATGWPIYLFNMEYANDNLQPNSYPIKGPSHSTFLLYLLQNKLATNEDDKYLVNTFLNSFSQFVKTDSPSTKDQMWPKIDSNRPSIHVAIKRSLNEIKNSLLSTRHNFWKNELKFDGHITIPYKAITISESTHTEL